MGGDVTGLVSSLGGFYSNVLGSLPSWAQNFLSLFLWSLLLVIYSIFIWKFYRWIAKKDILQLNLARFDRSDHAVLAKIIGGFMYFVEYLIILPLVVFLWFGVFTFFLMLLTKSLELNTILVISVTIVAAIRMTAYYKEDLARDIAKLIPLTLLTVAISQGLFNFEKVIEQIVLIPTFFSDIWSYLIFIVLVEFLLRVLDVIFIAFDLYDEKEIKADDTIKEEAEKKGENN
ncbi:hypothetical protein GW931_00130 [archaeon]|nr:hypothetical protein [archaeon]PJC45416.1 MAG: hypothetical protein CO037_01595 [Candidatus Pacearchaeota archaeon CG_4_9_14_0_2_um_filter_30_8]